MLGTSAEAEQRPAQSERLSQLSESARVEDSAQRRWSGLVRAAIRDHCGEAGLKIKRRRSPAKPDGLGSVLPQLNENEGIFARALTLLSTVER